MKKRSLMTIAILAGLTVDAAQCQETKLPVLDAFKTCNASAMLRGPIKLPGGLIVTKIKKENDSMGTRIELDFNKRADPNKENQAGMIKRLTGYDFTDLSKYEIDEEDGNPWIACRAPK